MKKLNSFLLIIGFAFILGTCNTPSDPNGGGGGGGGQGGGQSEEGVYNWGSPGYKNPEVFGTGDEWPGYTLKLDDCPTPPKTTIDDISKYSSVILDAVLYDRAGNKFPTGTNPIDLQALFHILSSGSGWGDDRKLATKYNMVLEGETSAPVTKPGIPDEVLVQGRYVSSKTDTEQVGYIEIRKLTFVPKPPAGTVVLDRNYPESDTTYMEVSENQVTFKNATYKECAAQYAFPSEWGATAEESLKGKTITFTFNIPTHTCVLPGNPPTGTTGEHQIHIQAAHDEGKDKFNGQHPDDHGGVGQVYIDLDGKTSFTVSADKLIAASKVSGSSANDGIVGPFVLDTVRIVNNGTEWKENATTTHYRCKSYTLVFNSITIN